VTRELLAIFALVLAVRLTHAGVLWIEEAYPMAAAQQLLMGRWPYADFWYDKPPGAIWFYALWGARPGWLMRLAGALYVTACAALAWRLGGRWAAWLLAVYLSFGIPSAVMALAPDLLLVAPHLGAVWLAQTGRPLAAGLVAGMGMLIHTKALFVLAVVLLWQPGWRALAGFTATLPLHLVFGEAYWQQVWAWGRVYASNTFIDKPLLEFLRRTANWLGFHLSAVAGLCGAHLSWRDWAWLGLSLASVTLGQRFFPRYYFFLLAPVVVLAGRALGQLRARWRWALLALLLIPLARFGPRAIQLALGDTSWDDLALHRDSQQVARYIREHGKPEDTLFVWGYRPDIDALARRRGGAPFLESQPLNCVFADRHLTQSKPLSGQGCEERLRRFREAEPNWLVDGLGPLNARLRLEAYRNMKGYALVLRTPSAYLYRLVEPRNQPLDVLLTPADSQRSAGL
jgi:hypothetical protein